MTDEPKAPGISEKIVSAIVPPSIAKKLDNSDRVVETWRSAWRYLSTKFDATQFAALIVVGWQAYKTEHEFGISLGMPIWLAGAIAILAGIGSFLAKFRKQNLPPPPPPVHDDTNDAGA